MKVLRINSYMLLPDYFAGTMRDAVNLWLDCFEGENPDHGLTADALTAAVSLRVALEPFHLNSRYGFSIVAESGVWELKHRKWTKVIGSPEGAYGEGDTWAK